MHLHPNLAVPLFTFASIKKKKRKILKTSPILQSSHPCDARRICAAAYTRRCFQSDSSPRKEFRACRTLVADGRHARRATGCKGAVAAAATISTVR